MLIREVTTKVQKPPKPTTAAQQRVRALMTQLDQAREAARRQKLAARQVKLNQARAEINQPRSGGSENKTPAL